MKFDNDRCHFVGVAGSGMSALAQFFAMEGVHVSGSDRSFDQDLGGDIRRKLENGGIRIFPQDGSALGGLPGSVVVSTAIETENPDIRKAVKLGLPIRHRAEVLAAVAREHKTVAVAGTSGKSTVAAMIHDIYARTRSRISVITGGPIVSLRDDGLLGNAYNAKTELLVIEADESDGSLVHYDSPRLSVLLNLTKDHKEIAQLQSIFGAFLKKSPHILLNADDRNLSDFSAGSFYDSVGLKSPRLATFGFGTALYRAEFVDIGPAASKMSVNGVLFNVPVPGRHNAQNALAAAAACAELGVSLEDCSRGLEGFKGVSRRLELVGECGGVQVIDDFAHNPEKIRAALETVQMRSQRVLAVYQPHGFYPTRFLKRELIEAFSTGLRNADRLWMPDIYYAGGSSQQDVSSGDIAGPVRKSGRQAAHVPERKQIIPEIVETARPGDAVLVMGARDPSLHGFAEEILRALCLSFSAAGRS